MPFVFLHEALAQVDDSWQVNIKPVDLTVVYAVKTGIQAATHIDDSTGREALHEFDHISVKAAAA
ncbi:hypothetical protein SDC9_131648 [bioreactor metagenome]|uniref:Uncharacterized protein n=1 Tax=bioreactor metagenome TaxID=1076179 RepID=A0A645D5T6_9ZZZZ